MAKKYITAVFEYDEGAAFPVELTKAFHEDVPFHDVRITAVSFEDEITRAEQLESALEERD